MTTQALDPQITVTAERCTLRPLRRSDTGLLSMYMGDERLARATQSVPHPLPPGATEAYVARALAPQRDHDVWAMDGTAQGLPELLGVIALGRMDRGQSEITYWVAPAFWNTGLASDAVRALIDARPQGARTVFGAVFQDNPASARVLTNCGFSYLGDAESYCVARGGMVPTWTYARTLV